MPISSVESKPLRLPGGLLKPALVWVRTHLMRLLVSLVVAGAIAYFGTPYIFGPVVTVDTVIRQDIVQTVVASGQVQTPYRVNVGAQVTGLVSDVPVDEGQTVKAGDLLIRLDDGNAREAVKLAQGVVAQSQARLRQLLQVAAPAAVETKKQAEAAVTEAQLTYDRALKLHTQGYETKANLDDAKKALDVAQSQVRAADIQLTASQSGGMDYITAQTQLEQSQASLRAAEAQLGYTQIRAPRDGVLITRNVERGNVVQPGVALLVLAPAGETQILVEIDETNLGLMLVGETATVSADAYPKQSFQAKLFYINPSVDPAKGSVEVKLAVPNPPAYLTQDMTVSAEIEVARRPQAIAVGTDSIHELTGAKPWVLAVQNGRAVKRTITVGAIGDATTEVTSGLSQGDTVVHGTGAGIADGARVRPRSGA